LSTLAATVLVGLLLWIAEWPLEDAPPAAPQVSIEDASSGEAGDPARAPAPEVREDETAERAARIRRLRERIEEQRAALEEARSREALTASQLEDLREELESVREEIDSLQEALPADGERASGEPDG
jgi:acyl-CoA reductase-like NAD-dependent aldehyde dehydrogenase